MTLLDARLYADLPWPATGLFLMIGAALGSFFNVLALRWPRWQVHCNDMEASFWLKLRGLRAPEIEQPSDTRQLMGGRSHCPTCSKPIPLFLNIPILSWLMLRGRSACCKTPIHIRYLGFELLGSGIFLGISLTCGPTAYGLVIGTLLMVLALIAVIDLTDSFIPDQLLFVALLISYGLTFSSTHWMTLEQTFLWHVGATLALLALGGLFRAFFNVDGIGGADVHLIGLCGALLGGMPMLYALVICGLLAKPCLSLRNRLFPVGAYAQVIGERGVPLGPILCSGMIGIVFTQLALA